MLGFSIIGIKHGPFSQLHVITKLSAKVGEGVGRRLVAIFPRHHIPHTYLPIENLIH